MCIRDRPKGYDQPVNAPNDEVHLIEQSAPYDYRPPAYNSDTQSGGPSNFDGNMGGDNNPRIPELEGEVAGEYNKKLEDFKAQIADAGAGVNS